MSTSHIPVSSVIGESVIPDEIVASDDEFNALDAPLTKELAGSSGTVLQVEPRLCRYEGVWLSSEQIADPIFPVLDVQSSHGRSLVTPMSVLAFGYRNGMITVTWCAEANPTDSAREHAAAKHGGGKVVEEGFGMILLNGRHCCCAVHQLKTKAEDEVD